MRRAEVDELLTEPSSSLRLLTEAEQTITLLTEEILLLRQENDSLKKQQQVVGGGSGTTRESSRRRTSQPQPQSAVGYARRLVMDRAEKQQPLRMVFEFESGGATSMIGGAATSPQPKTPRGANGSYHETPKRGLEVNAINKVDVSGLDLLNNTISQLRHQIAVKSKSNDALSMELEMVRGMAQEFKSTNLQLQSSIDSVRKSEVSLVKQMNQSRCRVVKVERDLAAVKITSAETIKDLIAEVLRVRGDHPSAS